MGLLRLFFCGFGRTILEEIGNFCIDFSVFPW